MQSARIWNWAQTFSAIYCLNNQLIGRTRATKHTCQSHVPILLVTWKMGGFKQKVLSSKLFIRSRYEYLEIKVEMLICCLIFIFWCQTQMFQSTAKIMELASLFQYFWRGVYIMNVEQCSDLLTRWRGGHLWSRHHSTALLWPSAIWTHCSEPPRLLFDTGTGLMTPLTRQKKSTISRFLH